MRASILSTLLSMMVIKVLATAIMAIKQKKEKKGLKIRKEEVSFFTIGDAQLLLKSPLETLCLT